MRQALLRGSVLLFGLVRSIRAMPENLGTRHSHDEDAITNRNNDHKRQILRSTILNRSADSHYKNRDDRKLKFSISLVEEDDEYDDDGNGDDGNDDGATDEMYATERDTTVSANGITDDEYNDDDVFNLLSRFKKDKGLITATGKGGMAGKGRLMGKGGKIVKGGKIGKGGKGGKGGKEGKGGSSKISHDESDFPTSSPAPSTSSPFPTSVNSPKGGKGKSSKCSGGKGGKGGKGKSACIDSPSASPSPSPFASDLETMAPTLTAMPTMTGKKSKKGMKCSSAKGKGAGCAPSPSPAPTNCEPTSGDCVSTLSALVNELNRAEPDSTISICDGTTITSNSIITINQDSTTLCCEGSDCALASNGNDSVLFVQGQSVTLQDLRFENGYSSRFNGGNVAIQADGDHLITRCDFVGGFTFETGGNLFVETKGTVTIEESSFIDGGAGKAGGGVAVLDASSVVIRMSTFANNEAVNGGGFFSNVDPDQPSLSQDIVIEDSGFVGNTATAGAGLLVSELGSLPSLSIINSEFITNEALEAGGAGVILVPLDTLDLELRGNIGVDNTGTRCQDFLTVLSDNASSSNCIAVDESYS